MRKGIFITLIILITLITACTKEEEVTPHERFDLYIDLWNHQEFTKMYDMISTDAREEFSPEHFIDRYNKIYEDLNVSELKVSYNKLSDEDLEIAMEEGEATLPFTVTMESIAGPINFEYDATLIQEGSEEEEDKEWFIAWNPG